MTTTCLLCQQSFEARHSYGLCATCQNQHTLREYDRLESRIRQARRAIIQLIVHVTTHNADKHQGHAVQYSSIPYLLVLRAIAHESARRYCHTKA
jgi:hypothetical protein